MKKVDSKKQKPARKLKGFDIVFVILVVAVVAAVALIGWRVYSAPSYISGP